MPMARPAQPETPRRVLIVVSSYCPAMSASMHRARLLAWSLAECGWQVQILAPSAEFQRPEWMDPKAQAFFQPGNSVLGGQADTGSSLSISRYEQRGMAGLCAHVPGRGASPQVSSLRPG